MSIYNEHYQSEDLFGQPYPELLDFFEAFKSRGKLIDLGCGQGRNALSLARMGYEVVGIDLSKVGINQMLGAASKENLTIKGIVGDIYQFNNFVEFDIVLIDSMFHFSKNDKKHELSLVTKIANNIKSGGTICSCVQDTGKKVRILKDALRKTGIDFKVLNDSTFNYIFSANESGHKSTTRYCMYIVKKMTDSKNNIL